MPYKDKLKQKEYNKLNLKKWRIKNPHKTKEQTQRHYQKHRLYFIAKAKEIREKLRSAILDHYGRFCNCCGEKELIFLTVDHVNNDGYKVRKKNKNKNLSSSTSLIYRNIIKSGFPDDIQILCYNCNCGKARNGGICPHKNE